MQFMEEHLDMPLRQVLPIMQDRIRQKTSYFGIKTLKSPLDFWVYQEIIFETKPDLIIEIGNFCGGSTLALAHIFDRIGHGKVIGIDVLHNRVPQLVRQHPRITLIEGDACASFGQVQEMARDAGNIMVIEDSSHTFENTLNVLETYSKLIKPDGGYFIVEDGICHHGLDLGPSPGPYEAIDAFVAGNPDFEVDRGRESFLITWNPKGYIRRIR